MGKTILVVGGAGYIGSHLVRTLANHHYRPIVYDSLVSGYLESVKEGEFVQGDLADETALEALFDRFSFDAVMHFASFIQVAESTANPEKYYFNNVSNTLNLLKAMRRHHVNHFIFSSSAAVYGTPLYTPIDEKHPRQPINPYGKTKSMVEDILVDYDAAYSFRSMALRYFNAAGADPKGDLGERHDPETHLIPLVLRVASGESSSIKVYGNDYDTPDGTCVRDYIHVCDLAEAHFLALEHLFSMNRSDAFNLGNGLGYSVNQVIEVARQVTGKAIPVEIVERRAGDPPVLVASSVRAMDVLKWAPRYACIEDIVAHAWQWEKNKPSRK